MKKRVRGSKGEERGRSCERGVEKRYCVGEVRREGGDEGRERRREISRREVRENNGGEKRYGVRGEA